MKNPTRILIDGDIHFNVYHGAAAGQMDIYRHEDAEGNGSFYHEISAADVTKLADASKRYRTQPDGTVPDWRGVADYAAIHPAAYTTAGPLRLYHWGLAGQARIINTGYWHISREDFARIADAIAMYETPVLYGAECSIIITDGLDEANTPGVLKRSIVLPQHHDHLDLTVHDGELNLRFRENRHGRFMNQEQTRALRDALTELLPTEPDVPEHDGDGPSVSTVKAKPHGKQEYKGNGKHNWEEVTATYDEDGDRSSQTSRLRVPGGWLYCIEGTNTLDGEVYATNTNFVPLAEVIGYDI